MPAILSAGSSAARFATALGLSGRQECLGIRFVLPPGAVEDLPPKQGIEVSPDIIRVRWQRFRPMIACAHREVLMQVSVRSNHGRHDLRRGRTCERDFQGHRLAALESSAEVPRAAYELKGQAWVGVTDKLPSYWAEQ